MSVSKKMVLKVDVVGSDECRAHAMSVVTKFRGVKSVAVDGEKGTVTVVGAVDVVRVAKALRKAGFQAEVLSVEDDKKPDPPPPKKPADDAAKKPPEEPKAPCCAGCAGCRPPPVPAAPCPVNVLYYEEQPDGYGCVIL